MKIICDTHVLLFWADAPERLSKKAAALLESGIESSSLRCSDISLWEIAMLHRLGRLSLPVSTDQYLKDIVMAMKLSVRPITAEIAVLSQSDFFQHKGHADRIIASTALAENALLITKDEKLLNLTQIKSIW